MLSCCQRTRGPRWSGSGVSEWDPRAALSPLLHRDRSIRLGRLSAAGYIQRRQLYPKRMPVGSRNEFGDALRVSMVVISDAWRGPAGWGGGNPLLTATNYMPLQYIALILKA